MRAGIAIRRHRRRASASIHAGSRVSDLPTPIFVLGLPISPMLPLARRVTLAGRVALHGRDGTEPASRRRSLCSCADLCLALLLGWCAPLCATEARGGRSPRAVVLDSARHLPARRTGSRTTRVAATRSSRRHTPTAGLACSRAATGDGTKDTTRPTSSGRSGDAA